MKNTLDGINSRLDNTKEHINNLDLKRMKCFQTYSTRPALPSYQNQTKALQKRKLQANIHDERRYKNLNNNKKNLNKLFLNQILKYIKRIIHHDQVGLIPGMQGCFRN